MVFVDNIDNCALRDSHKVFFYLTLLIFLVEVVMTVLASGVEKYTKFSSRTKQLFPNLEIINVSILTLILISEALEGHPIYVECGAPTVSGIAIQIAIVFRAFLGGARRLYMSSKTYRILFESVSQSSSWIRRCLLVYFSLVYTFAMYSVFLLDKKICCSEYVVLYTQKCDAKKTKIQLQHRYYRNELQLNITASVLDKNWAYSMDFSTFSRSFESMIELVMLSGWPTLMEGAESDSPQGLGDMSSRAFFFTYKLLFYLLVQPMMAGFMIQCVMTAWNEFERRDRYLDRLKKKSEDDDDDRRTLSWTSRLVDCLKCCFCVVRDDFNDDNMSREYREWEEEEENDEAEEKRDSTFQRQDSTTIRVIRKRRKSEILRQMVARNYGDGDEEESSSYMTEKPRDLLSKIDHLERIIKEQREKIKNLQQNKKTRRGAVRYTIHSHQIGTYSYNTHTQIRHRQIPLEHSLIRELDGDDDDSSWEGTGLM